MSKFGIKNLWDIKAEGSNLLSTDNTFTGKNTFENTGDVVSIKRTDDQSFGIVFKKEDGDRVGYIGTSDSDTNKATVWGATGLKLQTTNSLIELSSGSGDLIWDGSRNWNQNVDNTIVRTKDLKYVRKWEYTSLQNLPSETWNTTNWKWAMDGINTDGIHEFIIVITTQDNTSFTFNPKIIWKSGMSTSNSSKFILDKLEGGVIEFVFTIKSNNQFHINHKKVSGNITLSWVRCWVVRNNNLPWKVNTLW